MRRMLEGRFVALLLVVGALLAACGQLDEEASIGPQLIVTEPNLTFSKDLSVLHSQSFVPEVTDKTASELEVDATDGTAELSYTMVVEDVLAAESDTASVANVLIENTGGAGITVDIEDRLYCDDGTGAPDLDGAIDVLVFEANDVLIAAGGSFTWPGPSGPHDVSACPSADGVTKDVVNRLVVRDASSDAVIAVTDFVPTERSAISSIAAAFLVDEEAIPAGYTVMDAALTTGGLDVPFSATASAGSYTIVTDDPVGAGTYQLTKTLTRDAGVACEPASVLNGAYMSSDGTEAGMIGTEQTATIALICTPTGGEGCTPGFWKEWTGVPPGNQPNAWEATGYRWSDPFTEPGFVNAFRGKTLLQVLDHGGGGKNALGRHAVAAVLNAAHPNVDYDLTEAQVVAMFNDVIENDGDVNALKKTFESLNEQGCPLSQAVY